MIYLTADSHLNHKNIIQYCNRPFQSVEEMDDVIISRWNSVVTKDDTVYVLGDFSLSNKETVYNYISRLNGDRIYFLKGSHDRWLEGMHPGYVLLTTGHGVAYYLGEICQIEGFTSGKHSLPTTLYHYALRVWACSHYGSMHFFGHSHGHLPPLGRSCDVGVDSWDFYPADYEVLKEQMLKIEPHNKPKETKDGQDTDG